MQYNKLKRNKRYKKMSVAVLALFAAVLLVGCGEVEIPDSMPTAVPMYTDAPSVTEVPVATNVPEVTQAPVATPTVQATTEPTATPTPDTGEYPALKNDGHGWGLSYRGGGLQPWGNEAAKTLKAYDAYYVGSASGNTVYLTFDCGYENGNTAAILDALKNHDVKATFFVTGHFLETETELVQRMVNEGHAVANHTYNHPDITKLDEATFREELDSIQRKFEELTGSKLSMYFRPPEGKCYTQTLKWSKQMGYATILWSVAHVDWYTDNQPDPDESIQRLTDRIHSGAIVLLHNTSQTNATILDALITTWEDMGYTIQPLSHLVGK